MDNTIFHQETLNAFLVSANGRFSRLIASNRPEVTSDYKESYEKLLKEITPLQEQLGNGNQTPYEILESLSPELAQYYIEFVTLRHQGLETPLQTKEDILKALEPLNVDWLLEFAPNMLIQVNDDIYDCYELSVQALERKLDNCQLPSQEAITKAQEKISRQQDRHGEYEQPLQEYFTSSARNYPNALDLLESLRKPAPGTETTVELIIA